MLSSGSLASDRRTVSRRCCTSSCQSRAKHERGHTLHSRLTRSRLTQSRRVRSVQIYSCSDNVATVSQECVEMFFPFYKPWSLFDNSGNSAQHKNHELHAVFLCQEVYTAEKPHNKATNPMIMFAPVSTASTVGGAERPTYLLAGLIRRDATQFSVLSETIEETTVLERVVPRHMGKIPQVCNSKAQQ